MGVKRCWGRSVKSHRWWEDIMCQSAFDILLVAGLKHRGQLLSIPHSSSGIMRDLSTSGLNGITGKEKWRAKSVSTSSSCACFHLVCPLLSERKITVFLFIYRYTVHRDQTWQLSTRPAYCPYETIRKTFNLDVASSEVWIMLMFQVNMHLTATYCT